ncbi:FecR family protein [Olivibacter domesticus]|uniref:FecR family protein n=1 Tax=Olivibacter domesticus TaxID=407022 RepID=A0A1H7MLH1_OLID1|nr:FecR family protein [Olivibacter domesticus]SEL12146.1 FecR family protein [Olivibacter domesticus]
MDKRRLALLLKKYLNNKASDEEKNIIDDWIGQKQNEDNHKQKLDPIAIREKLKTKIDQKIIRNKYRRINLTLVVGFIFVTLFTLSIKYYYGGVNAYKQENYLINVPKGKKIRVKLIDGSVVWLNAESRFEYPKTFNKEKRAVNLLGGEAFFDIATDKTRPFIVETNASQTQVLGTTFNIKTGKSDKAVITLVNGAVRVSRKKADAMQGSIDLKPNEQLVLERNRLPLKKKVNTSQIIGWNRIYFDNQSLEEAIKVLIKAYGVQVVLKEESIRNIKFSASFSLADKPADVIYELAKANNIRYKWENEKVTLY